MFKSQDQEARSNDILIVDDEIANLQLLSDLLRGEDYQVRPANSSQLAIDSALAQPPKLILLDVMMPEMDGFEVCRHLKQDDRTRDIPIIFVSALQDTKAKVRGLGAGGVDFISKPFQREEILARVRTHMDLRNMQVYMEEMIAERTAEVIEREERFRATFEQAAVGIAHVALDGHFLRLNQKFCDIVGFSMEEMMTKTFQDITHPEDLDADSNLAKQLLEGKRDSYALEKRYIRKDSSSVWVNLTVKILRDNDGEPKWLVSVIEDISDRKLAEQKLLEYQKRLKSLTSQLTLAEEQERRRIAANLHDDVTQSLAITRLQLAAATRDSEDARLREQLDEISKRLLQAIRDTRQLIFELSSPAMHELGLGGAIAEWAEENLKKVGETEFSLVDNLSGSELDEEKRIILFRNLRELLTNTIKHAGATKVNVILETIDNDLRITVQDDGIGFDPERALNQFDTKGGFGLFSIHERMEGLGGKLEIHSAPQHGCTAVLSVPCSEQPESSA